MDELKPCPFCGADSGSLYVVTVEQRGYETVGIFCNACKQTVTVEENEWEGNNEKTRAAAIEAWNRRHPQRMRGRWMELTNTNHTYICSICGRMLVNVADGKNTVTKNYPFCHCGADMRGEQDE